MDGRENEMLTRVGPGTPAGEALRKYWIPVGFSQDITSDEPRFVTWLGEDLVIFRDEFGRVGLIHPFCAHRNTSLEYGWIEGGGLRCCYHGWVFDVGGRCLEQPGEPPGSAFKEKIRLTAYPVRELGGLVWAYMGAGDPPSLPRYDFLVREDGERTFAGYLRACNFMNQLDNCLDPVHATVLHGREVHGVRQNPERQESPGFEVLAELARELDGAVGASRVPCDLGWCPHSMQIGLTGKTVTPELYIAVGISGAGHHMAGCGNARNIVAINTDAEAAIYRDARWGIVGDYRKIVPSLIAAIRELRAAERAPVE